MGRVSCPSGGRRQVLEERFNLRAEVPCDPHREFKAYASLAVADPVDLGTADAVKLGLLRRSIDALGCCKGVVDLQTDPRTRDARGRLSVVYKCRCHGWRQ